MPKRVAVVAGAFVLIGVLALVGMLKQLLDGGITFDPAALLLPAGIALFQGHPASRRWAAFFLGIAIALFAATALFTLWPPTDDLTVSVFGRTISGLIPVGVALAVLAAACGLGVWMLYSRPASAFFAGHTEARRPDADASD